MSVAAGTGEQLWKIEPQRSDSVVLLHCGGRGLFDNAGAPLDSEAALAALRERDVELLPGGRRRPGWPGCSAGPVRVWSAVLPWRQNLLAHSWG